MYHASLNRDPEFVPNGQEGACRPSALKRTVLRAQFLSLFFWLIKEAKTRPFKRDFAIAEDTSLTLYAVIWYLITEAFSGELRNGSSLHAGFYDLILFFLVSSFILILDRCV